MSLKTISSMRVRANHWPEIEQALWGDHFWSPSYAVVSADGAPLDIVKRYIENQQSPNRKPGQLGKIRGRQRASPFREEGACARPSVKSILKQVYF